MYINESRVEEIFQELCEQLKKITVGELKDNAYRILEEKAEFHESEERRAKVQLSITIDDQKQKDIYREINLKHNRAKANSQAYKRAKQGF